MENFEKAYIDTLYDFRRLFCAAQWKRSKRELFIDDIQITSVGSLAYNVFVRYKDKTEDGKCATERFAVPFDYLSEDKGEQSRLMTLALLLEKANVIQSYPPNNCPANVVEFAKLRAHAAMHKQ